MANLLPIEAIQAAESQDLYELLHEVREVIATRDKAALLDLVRERVAADADLTERGVNIVCFATDEWDNGWFYSENVTTFTFADNRVETIHGALADKTVAYRGNDILRETLTELSADNGPLTGMSELTVNLVTGDITGD